MLNSKLNKNNKYMDDQQQRPQSGDGGDAKQEANTNTSQLSPEQQQQQLPLEEGKYTSQVDPELHRLVTEWRVRRLRDDYKPYSEAELRQFGAQWRLPGPLPLPPSALKADARIRVSESEISAWEAQLETMHAALVELAERLHDLAWTRACVPARNRRSHRHGNDITRLTGPESAAGYGSEYWDHINLTLHLAGATVEEVWEILHGEWPRLLKAQNGYLSFGEAEKIEQFVTRGGEVLLRCDALLSRDVDSNFNHDGNNSKNKNRERRSKEKERACLADLYEVLRTFPLAPWWKRRTLWDVRDAKVRPRRSLRRMVRRVVRWFWTLFSH